MKLKYEYPYNAILEIVYSSNGRDKNRDDGIVRDLKNDPYTEITFESLIQKLGETDCDIIHLYYRDNYTVKAIAEKMGVSDSRASYILHKAIHDFWKRPSFSEKIMLGIEGYYEKKLEKQREYSEKYGQKRWKEGYKKGYIEGYEAAEIKHNPEFSRFEFVDIDTLGLSVRAYNVLHRCGIRSLKELMEVSPENLARLHNMGMKTYGEIMDVLQRYGVDTQNYMSVLDSFNAIAGRGTIWNIAALESVDKTYKQLKREEK